MNDAQHDLLRQWFKRIHQHTNPFPKPLKLFLRKRQVKALGLQGNQVELDAFGRLWYGGRILITIDECHEPAW